MEENKIVLANKEPFKVLLITPNKIEDREWNDETYLHKLVNDSFCSYIKISPDTFLECIAEHLNIAKHNNPDVQVQVISEQMNHNYEIMYIPVKQGPKEEVNEFGTLLNINDDIIIGNAIVYKTYISMSDNTMHYEDITPKDIEEMLYKRANTKVVVYDSDNDSYKEEVVFGPLDIYSEMIFGENKYNIKKLEIPFLKHNINIWYTENKYGELDVAGNLLPELARVDKMIVFSMWSMEYRDSLTLEEFNMIKFLSKKLDEHIIKEEVDEKDELGRLIIKNKYRILYQYYNKLK
jgi:hypothetical protein